MERGCMETDGPEFINLQECFKQATATRHQASHCLDGGQQTAAYRQRLSEPKNRTQIYLWIVANDPSEQNDGSDKAQCLMLLLNTFTVSYLRHLLSLSKLQLLYYSQMIFSGIRFQNNQGHEEWIWQCHVLYKIKPL